MNDCNKINGNTMNGNIMNYNSEILNLPKEIRNMIAHQEYEVDNIGMSGSKILMFADKVLKVQQETAETESECAMLKWLAGKLPVPKILCQVSWDSKNYLLMSRVQGQMSCAEEFMSNPKQLVSILAEALKALWSVDISDCPMAWQLDKMLTVAKESVEKGEVDVDNVEPETFGEGGFKDPEDLLAWLVANKPEEELVLSHGDFCLPNIFVQDGKLAGFIDLGRCGVADKWKDIAICYRSLLHNFSGVYDGKVYEGFQSEMLFEALGIEPDWDKIKYYILLDELF